MKTDFARQQMVDQQIRAWDVLESDILDVMKAVPREQFVPAGYETLAFADLSIPIGHGETMMTPTLEGRLLQALELRQGDDVLEIGTGTGFLSACLVRLAGSVTSVDIYDDFLRQAANNLDAAGVEGVELLRMDATSELPARSFDAIAVTGSLQTFDPRLAKALKPGGRLFIVVGNPPVMDARRVRRSVDDESWSTESLFETQLKPLRNGALPPQFSF
jgi:protein-L-isoaspartate(D-aspartate) O-methyltransferase